MSLRNTALQSRLACLIAIFLPALAQADALDLRARAVFGASFGEACGLDNGQLTTEPVRFDVAAPQSFTTDTSAVTLWQFECFGGAYNTNQVYLISSEVNGILPVALPSPSLTIVTEDPEDFESAVLSVSISGWRARVMATNSQFDPKTLLLSEYSLWRGSGDASEAVTYELFDGGFRLKHYEVDASYDGEVSHQVLFELTP